MVVGIATAREWVPDKDERQGIAENRWARWRRQRRGGEDGRDEGLPPSDTTVTPQQLNLLHIALPVLEDPHLASEWFIGNRSLARRCKPKSV